MAWQLPKDQGMPELFSGDYSFVQSEYFKACAVGRSEHQGGGFIGKLNQDTEMIMCCNENQHDGLSIPIVMEGVGTFTEYGSFDDPAPRGIDGDYKRTENAHVGAIICNYPSAYPTWTPALKAKNLEECANECSFLDDCGGFNIYQNGGNCQLCTNDDISAGESSVTAYLKKASPPEGSYYGMCSKVRTFII